MRYLIAIVMALSANNALAATVFKCELPNGQTQFSDQPCPGNVQSEQLEITHDNIGGTFTPSDGYFEEQEAKRLRLERREIERRYQAAQDRLANAPCREFNRTDLRTMIIKHQVVEGMTQDSALRAWGRPTRHDDWQHSYFWARGAPSFFYIKNGCVDSVQGQWGG